MIKIELQEECYECDRFDLDIDVSSIMKVGDAPFVRTATVRCIKSDVCKKIEQEGDHER